MTLQELYYNAGGSAFHHEITEDIAVAYLSEQFKDLTEKAEYSDDLEEERDQLQDELTELKEGILSLKGNGNKSGRGSRLIRLLESLNDDKSEYISNNLIKGDIEGILEALEVLA